MLHFKLFGKTFNPEFIKSPFLETVKIKIVISLVTTSGNIYFDFTEKSHYFIGKHIRKNILSDMKYDVKTLEMPFLLIMSRKCMSK